MGILGIGTATATTVAATNNWALFILIAGGSLFLLWILASRITDKTDVAANRAAWGFSPLKVIQKKADVVIKSSYPTQPGPISSKA
jgi:hypothetical protein